MLYWVNSSTVCERTRVLKAIGGRTVLTVALPEVGGYASTGRRVLKTEILGMETPPLHITKHTSHFTQ